MKKITWKRWMAATGCLAIGCLLYLTTAILWFFVAGLAAFFIVLIAEYIG